MLLKDIEIFFNVKECVVLKWLKKFNIHKNKDLHILNISKTKINKVNSDILKFTEKHDYLPLKAREYLYINNMREVPICPICHKQVRWNVSSGSFYITCGDKECISIYRKTIGYEKAKMTLLEKYGDEKYNNMEKNHNTNRKNHNGKLSNNIEKMRETCMTRYGVDNYRKSQKCKELWKDENFINRALTKNYESKRKNNSFNKSNPENAIYDILIEKYPDLKRQYKSDVYPYSCDFYIPSKDLYIEINFHWTHGGMLFDENNEICQQKLNIWKMKSINSKYFLNAIYTWTVLDYKKHLKIREHNLNFIIFYNMKEFNEWCENNI